MNPATEEVIAEVAAGNHRRGAELPRRPSRPKNRGRTSGKSGPLICAPSPRPSKQVADLARLEVMDNGKPLPEADWDIADAGGCFEFTRALPKS